MRPARRTCALLVLVVAALPLTGMRALPDGDATYPTVPLVPVTRFDSPLERVAAESLPAVVVPASLADAQLTAVHAEKVTRDADPIARVRRTGEVALVPPSLVTSGVKTLLLGDRFFWRAADRRAWPLRVRAPHGDPVAETWSMVAGGGMIFGRGVQWRIEQRFRGDARHAFAGVREAFRAADLALATLEAPLSGEHNRWCHDCTVFVGNESYASAIADAGIDVASLAANHIGDDGPVGVTRSIAALDLAGVKHVGAGPNADAAAAPLVVTVAHRRVAFVAFDAVAWFYAATAAGPGSNWAPVVDAASFGAAGAAARQRVLASVSQARERADLVVVVPHWGVEYEDHPRPEVEAFAHALVDAGASLILADHPHWAQSVERYNGAYIAYSMGNFVFDQMWSEETRQGTIHELWFSGSRLVSVRIHPTILEDYYRPRLLAPTEPAYRTVLRRIWAHSRL